MESARVRFLFMSFLIRFNVYSVGTESYLRILVRRKLGFERNTNDKISLVMNVVRLLFTVISVRKSQ